MSKIISPYPNFPRVFFLLLLLLCISFHGISQTENDEQIILMKLKEEWRNPPAISSWTSSNVNHCNWTGIVCVEGSVTGISLSGMEISRKIPATICDLKNLTGIDLSRNFIGGEFPTVLYNCSKLETLDLSDNRFVGRIPADIHRFSRLMLMNLGYNGFTGDIPAGIGSLPVLQTLNLRSSEYSGSFPPEIGNLSNLENLDLSSNSLFVPAKIPSEWGQLKKMKNLWMTSSNLIGEIPESISNMTDLESLDLSANNLIGKIPESLISLKNLYLCDNQLSGEIPVSIGRSRALVALLLYENNLTGALPSELGRYSNLETLEVYSNRFTGNLPENLCAGGVLNEINVESNNLSGEVPRSLANCNTLQTLNLRNNSFSGEFPPGILSTWNISWLIISDNRFSGEIPSFNNKGYFVFEASNNPGLCSDDPDLNLTGCKLRKRILILAGGVSLIVVLFSFFVIRCCRRRKLGRIPPATWELTSFHRLDFTESDILSSLTENNLIGSGGSGKVYRIPINRSGESIAVKKIWNNRKLDWKFEKQFEAEVQILGTIRHSNIVKLFCCISNENSKLLVYEYMENQSLDQWIHKKNRETSGDTASVHHVVLDWPKRLEIAVGAAQGLYYMHHDCSPAIIHRDVKSSNILLDSEFKAKIADFGLAKMLIKRGEANTMSTIAGSFGYLAPEYAYTIKVDQKIDVYSFGVVLLELVTGRKACDGDEHTSLAEWAWRHFQDGKAIVDIVDEDIKEPSCYLDEISIVLKLGLICTGALPSTRPSLKEVLQILLRCDSL